MMNNQYPKINKLMMTQQALKYVNIRTWAGKEFSYSFLVENKTFQNYFLIMIIEKKII